MNTKKKITAKKADDQVGDGNELLQNAAADTAEVTRLVHIGLSAATAIASSAFHRDMDRIAQTAVGILEDSKISSTPWDQIYSMHCSDCALLINLEKALVSSILALASKIADARTEALYSADEGSSPTD